MYDEIKKKFPDSYLFLGYLVRNYQENQQDKDMYIDAMIDKFKLTEKEIFNLMSLI